MNTGFRFGCPPVVQLQTEGAVNHAEETHKKFIKSPRLMALKGQPHAASGNAQDTAEGETWGRGGAVKDRVIRERKPDCPGRLR